jgi:transcriptional regulator with XRE-family HTH domain
MRGVLVCGEQFRNARIQRGLTQESLAERADLDVKTVRNAEAGKRVDLETLGRLAVALGANPSQFIGPGEAAAGLQDRRRDVVHHWLRAWDARDGGTLEALYHDDATMRLPGGPTIPFGGIYRGKAEIRRAHEIAWSTCRTEPIREGDLTFLVSEDVVLMQGVKGVYLPDGTIARLRCVHIYTFAGDLIIDHRADYDTLEFVSLLELPPPDDVASPGSSR